MKIKSLLGIVIALFFFAACKKDNPVNEPKNSIELLKDSASYVINGKSYTAIGIDKNMTYVTQSNLKITSGENFNYLLVGDKDSLLFVREYSIRAAYTNIAVSFIKIYNKNETEYTNENNGGYLSYPKNKTDIFSPGSYRYSTEFNRSNSTSGIAFTLINQQGIFKSYSQSDLGKQASVTPIDQKDSKFEIISLKKRKSDYLLEAKFNLNVFDENKKPLKIENGYLRLSILK
ncbi:hypothetical protein ASU31_07415 [Pedobacter ginsenosidimutans]|uniref:Lipoprotein n=1 Tax=Pedobacter ginsenosidimutans TaxID=687842 RepID=A0A0T5VRY9_9SPHI|nr:hypothetical protein [Pedobacter ginsenosidimutans]KRT16636.1 hypothetical protein ASU31_07415 [Pedobacter ginsenosidimutans]